MNLFNSSRRQFLIGTGLVGTSALLPAGRAVANADRAALAQDAFVWGLPLVLTGRYLDIAAKAGLPFNQFAVAPNLATPQTRAVGPNIDTLYGLAWLDLVADPQVIGVPDTHDRYYSIQLLDAYGDSFAYIGRRTTGTKAGAFAITAPGFNGSVPAGLTEIKAPTGKVLALVRTLVRGTADLPASRSIHTAYTLGPLSLFPNGRRAAEIRDNAISLFPFVDLSNAGAGYFDELDNLVRAYPPLAYDAPNLARFTPLGVGARHDGTRVTGRDPALDAELAAAVPTGIALAKRPPERWTVNGWSTNLNVEPFIRDPRTRAATNIYGPGTHIAQEALYFGAVNGPDGKSLTGANRYRLRFPKGQLPPVDAFWSLILYDKNFFLFDNPLDRYGITDRTAGLRYGSDGSLELLIQADQPADGASNWLPAPRDTYQLTMRTYQPRPEILNKTYRLPSLELVI